MRPILKCLLLLLPVLYTGTADAQNFGQNKVNYTAFKWQYIPTKNFDIYYTAGGYETALIASRIAEKSFESLSAHWGYTPRKRIPILVFNSHNDFAQTNVLTDIIEEGTGGSPSFSRTGWSSPGRDRSTSSSMSSTTNSPTR